MHLEPAFAALHSIASVIARAVFVGVIASLGAAIPTASGLAQRVALDPVKSLEGAPKVQVVAILDADCIDSLAGEFEPCAVIRFAESCLQAGGVPIVPLTESSDTSEAARELKCLQIEYHTADVAIMRLHVRRFASTLLVTLDVEQHVQVARNPAFGVQARTWGDERVIDAADNDDTPAMDEARQAISDMISEFITMYLSANK